MKGFFIECVEMATRYLDRSDYFFYLVFLSYIVKSEEREILLLEHCAIALGNKVFLG